MVQRSSITQQPPPDLPHMPEVSSTLANHLRTLSLWAKKSLDTKLDTQTATAGLLLEAHDAPAGTTPVVFKLQVKTDGTVVATPVATGSGRAG